MTTAVIPGRSAARAHLSQLIEIFGVDGCLQISTPPEPATAGDGEADDHEQA
ncbi:hypothetical protein OG778_16760 [Streptomyces sp. NBC_00184]|uniref:hypothetical protein n=1 Tax=unclassified Streptomyces TaxID=2593676 RepID=UPI002E2BD6B5|nr:hypothetical protein [Streptomyces sp. NBC_00184]